MVVLVVVVIVAMIMFDVDTCKEQGTVRSTSGTYYYECRCYDDNNDNNHDNIDIKSIIIIPAQK